MNRFFPSTSWVLVLMFVLVSCAAHRSAHSPVIPIPLIALNRIEVPETSTFHRMIAAGNYSVIGVGVMEERFPVAVAEDTVLQVDVVCFQREMNAQEVEIELDRMGRRSANSVETLAWGTLVDPRYEYKSVISVGAVWDSMYLGMFIDKDGRRVLALTWHDPDDELFQRWAPSACYLAAPK